jgi:hypothetical protein
MTFDSKQDDGEIFHQIGDQYHYLFECHLLKIEKKNKFLPNNLKYIYILKFRESMQSNRNPILKKI